MHLEIRREKDKKRYYLSHSYREGNRVHKFRKYLGQDLKEKLLDERKAIAEKLILEEIHKYNVISDPLRVELTADELAWVRKIEGEVPLKITHFSAEEWSTFSKLFTYNTNAIEGSRLNKAEVDNLLDHDKWPDKSKEDIAEAYGVDEALSFIQKAEAHVSIDLIKKIHKIVFKNSKSFAGQLRKKGEEVVVMGPGGIIVHEGAPAARVSFLLKQLVTWYDQNKTKYPGLVLAAVVHNQIENIHPFADGNGRVGRILLNNILLKHKLPPMNIQFKNRLEYYETLQAYEKKHDLKPTLKLYIKEYKELQKQLKK